METAQDWLAWALAQPNTAPQSLQGPTGLQFDTPQGYKASEIVGTFQNPQGSWQNLPLLVPGQANVASLLNGQPLTQEQINMAFAAAPPSTETFPTVEKALTKEQRRHKKLEKVN